MYEASEELKKYVDDQFKDLTEYPTCNTGYANILTNSEIYNALKIENIVKVEKFVNGVRVPEGEAFPQPEINLDDAIDKTRALIEELKKTYKNIVIRVTPKIEHIVDGWYIHFRAAVL
jgi:Zn-finger domain-containing protein